MHVGAGPQRNDGGSRAATVASGRGEWEDRTSAGGDGVWKPASSIVEIGRAHV